jgi:hypothetical protein
MTAYFCVFILFFFFVATVSSNKCKYHYTKNIMKFVNKYKSANNTVNIVQVIDKLSQATGETKLFLADCLGILNENNIAIFNNQKGRIKRHRPEGLNTVGFLYLTKCLFKYF